MNSLEAIEKLRIGHEQEAQQCIEIFRSFCQWYQSQYNFEQIESTFWNACIYLIEKHDLSEEKLIDFFLSQLDEYSYAAEPPVQFRLSHLSRRSEPL